jgi:hypothetical protein
VKCLSFTSGEGKDMMSSDTLLNIDVAHVFSLLQYCALKNIGIFL